VIFHKTFTHANIRSTISFWYLLHTSPYALLSRIFPREKSAYTFAGVVQGVIARCYCKVLLQGVIARFYCKVLLQGVISSVSRVVQRNFKDSVFLNSIWVIVLGSVNNLDSLVSSLNSTLQLVILLVFLECHRSSRSTPQRCIKIGHVDRNLISHLMNQRTIRQIRYAWTSKRVWNLVVFRKVLNVKYCVFCHIHGK
jgi:hypothetical protein